MEINGIAGEVITPSSAQYDAARRVWNGAIDRRPAAIVRCTGASDVRAALRHARDAGLPIAVRGGGHGVAGTAVCDGGLVIDLSGLRGVRVDPAAALATVEPGALWGDVDLQTQQFGLAVPGGIVTHTGVAGLTLGGGIGWLMRRYGLTIDSLLSVDLVTAGGEVLTADAERHPELFWAIRGGGGNFGIVTSFRFRPHPVGPEVLAGPVLWSLRDAPSVLRSYRDWIRGTPDELTTIVKLSQAPALAAIPTHLHGQHVLTIGSCYAGPLEEAVSVLKPLRGFGTPLLDLVAPRPYVANQALNDPTVPHGWHYYWKSVNLDTLTDEVIETLVAHAWRVTSPRSYILIFQLGGAVAEVAEDATAYSHRGAGHVVNINSVWLPEDPGGADHAQWTRDAFAALEPYQAGVYVNFLGDEGDQRVLAAYGPAKLARLAEVKATYDPDNVFRLNQNIAPRR